jgi:hypothetical protein
MVGIYLVVAGVLFIAGAVAGIFALVVIGIHGEERGASAQRQAPGKAVKGARAVTGMHVWPPGDSTRW